MQLKKNQNSSSVMAGRLCGDDSTQTIASAIHVKSKVAMATHRTSLNQSLSSEKTTSSLVENIMKLCGTPAPVKYS